MFVKIQDGKNAWWINPEKIVAMSANIWGPNASPPLVGKPFTRVWVGASEDDYFHFNLPAEDVLAALAG